jgi:hypothetical protein
MVGVPVAAVAVACWYQSFHQLAITVAPSPSSLATCPPWVNPCLPLNYRISNRWFARVVARCTVEVRGADGELLATRRLNTEDIPLMGGPTVASWTTKEGLGWLRLVRPPGRIQLAGRCSPGYIHDPLPG